MSKKAVAAIVLVPLLGLGACGATLLMGGAGSATAGVCGVSDTVTMSPISRPGQPGALPASIGRWRGDQVVNAGHIINAGQALQLDAWTVTVGVMTAMGESSLQNLDRGDSVGPDSRGLFQQRANGAWGSYEDRMNPTTAATSFYKALVQVPGYHELPPTIAAHRAQHNADPYHYEPFWPDAVQVVSALTGDPALLKNLPPTGGDTACTGTLLPGNGVGEQAVNAALTQLGVPYSWGGGGPNGPSEGFAQGAGIVGFDCSSLVQFAYWQGSGKTALLPRTSEAQRELMIQQNRMVPLSDLQPGDLLFFHGASHVAIHIGDGAFVHAPRTGKTVEVVKNWQSNGYWSSGIDGAARPDVSGQG